MKEDVRVQRLKKAQAEARRFIQASDAAITRFAVENAEKYGAVSTKEFAAAKRSSMDLSRALTELRKPQF